MVLGLRLAKPTHGRGGEDGFIPGAAEIGTSRSLGRTKTGASPNPGATAQKPGTESERERTP